LGDLSKEGNIDLGFEKMEICCLRILAEKVIENTAILFNIAGDREIPIDICIKPCGDPVDIEKDAAELIAGESRKLGELIENNESTDVLIKANEELSKNICSLKLIEKCCNKEIQYIDNIRVVCLETCEEFICNHKVKLTLKFKILLIVKFPDCCFELIMLPEDLGKKFYFNNVTFPITHCEDEIKKTLALDSCKEFFILTIEVPVKSFEGTLPPNVFDDPTLKSKLIIKNFKHDFDILKDDCSCNTGSNTNISLFSTADIIDKVGVNQILWVYGKPADC
jgi:hypothetical protein